MIELQPIMASIAEKRPPLNGSGYFLDSGDTEQIKKWQEVIGGITTNQVILFQKQGIKNVPAHLTTMCEIVGDNFPISVELPDSNWPIEKMFDLAQRYRQSHPTNTVIKVPILPNDVKGLKLIHKLAQTGIPTNATIGINYGQLTLAAEAARAYADQGVSYISLFWGRAQESYEREQETMRPQKLLEATLTYLANHNLPNTRVIVGSIREAKQVPEAFSLGADIVTVPPTILENLLKNQRAEETVQEFDAAFQKVKGEIIL